MTIEAAPDTGTRLRQEVEHNLDQSSPRLAQDVLASIIDTYPRGSAAMACYVTLTWSTAPRTGTGKRRSLAEMALHIGQRLPGFTRTLGATGAGAARPMNSAELAACCRISYDPASYGAIEVGAPASRAIGWSDAGPVAAEECWDHYRHDSGISSSWFMAKAPAGHVFSNTLAQLLAPHPDIARKRVTLVYRPHDPASAAKTVERDRLDAQFAAAGKKFGRARDAISKTAADKSAQEEAQGAGLVRFGLIATATVLGHLRPRAGRRRHGEHGERVAHHLAPGLWMPGLGLRSPRSLSASCCPAISGCPGRSGRCCEQNRPPRHGGPSGRQHLCSVGRHLQGGPRGGRPDQERSCDHCGVGCFDLRHVR